ncbi:hypothetical protein B0H12DRAFT_1111449, partial [Mycena haematopus]
MPSKHTGERPFACHCTKQFSRLDNLRQHAQASASYHITTPVLTVTDSTQTVHSSPEDKPLNERMMRALAGVNATPTKAAAPPLPELRLLPVLLLLRPRRAVLALSLRRGGGLPRRAQRQRQRGGAHQAGAGPGPGGLLRRARGARPAPRELRLEQLALVVLVVLRPRRRPTRHGDAGPAPRVPPRVVVERGEQPRGQPVCARRHLPGRAASAAESPAESGVVLRLYAGAPPASTVPAPAPRKRGPGPAVRLARGRERRERGRAGSRTISSSVPDSARSRTRTREPPPVAGVLLLHARRARGRGHWTLLTVIAIMCTTKSLRHADEQTNQRRSFLPAAAALRHHLRLGLLLTLIFFSLFFHLPPSSFPFHLPPSTFF